MKIVSANIRPCLQRLRDPTWKFARATVPQLEGHVLVLTDEDGVEGMAYVHAIPAITTSGGGAATLQFVTPMLVGRRADDLAAIVEEIDKSLAFAWSVKAAVDMALHDLLTRRLGVPVHVLLGGKLRDSIEQSRILAIKSPGEMGAQAARLVTEGLRQLKLKLSGDTGLDVQRIASVRDAAGADVALTLDPNQSYNAKQMIGAFAPHGALRHRADRAAGACRRLGAGLRTADPHACRLRSRPTRARRRVHDVFRLVAERAVRRDQPEGHQARRPAPLPAGGAHLRGRQRRLPRRRRVRPGAAAGDEPAGGQRGPAAAVRLRAVRAPAPARRPVHRPRRSHDGPHAMLPHGARAAARRRSPRASRSPAGATRRRSGTAATPRNSSRWSIAA